MRRGLKFIIPLILFLTLVFFLAKGLALNPREVPSPLINKRAPVFTLPMLNEQGKAFSSSSLLGKPWVLNVWASWCESCRDEHAALIEFAKQTNSMIVGMDYKDDDAQAINMISHLGNPYKIIVTDKDGVAGIEFGVYGVPETYVIDRTGIIRYKKTGPLTEQDLYHDVLPLLRE